MAVKGYGDASLPTAWGAAIGYGIWSAWVPRPLLGEMDRGAGSTPQVQLCGLLILLIYKSSHLLLFL